MDFPNLRKRCLLKPVSRRGTYDIIPPLPHQQPMTANQKDYIIARNDRSREGDRFNSEQVYVNLFQGVAEESSQGSRRKEMRMGK